MKNEKGYTDQAAEKDLLQIQNYIDGLKRFMLNCKTPMTISIQGTWGTGKTSIMQLIEKGMHEDHANVKCVWFNTWQFSQFSMGDELPISLLQCLLDAFDLPKEQSKDFKTQTSHINLAMHLENSIPSCYLVVNV